MFWFVLIALVAVVAVVALVVVGSSDGTSRTVHGGLADVTPDRVTDTLPVDRPLGREDIEQVRLPLALRGYRMDEVDDLLDRLAAELAERDARISELEAALAGARQAAPPAGGSDAEAGGAEATERPPHAS